jgi:hypothetical protein
MAITSVFFALFGFIFLVTQYFQLVRGSGPGLHPTRVRHPHPARRPLDRIRLGYGTSHRRTRRHHPHRDDWPCLDGHRFHLGLHELGNNPYPEIVGQMILLGVALASPQRRPPNRSWAHSRWTRPELAQRSTTPRELGGTLGVAIVFSSVYASALADGPVFTQLPTGGPPMYEMTSLGWVGHPVRQTRLSCQVWSTTSPTAPSKRSSPRPRSAANSPARSTSRFMDKPITARRSVSRNGPASRFH